MTIAVIDPRCLSEDIAICAREFDPETTVTQVSAYTAIVRALEDEHNIYGYHLGPSLIILDGEYAEDFAYSVAYCLTGGIDLDHDDMPDEIRDVIHEFFETVVFDNVHGHVSNVTGYRGEVDDDLYDMIDTEVSMVRAADRPAPPPPRVAQLPTAVTTSAVQATNAYKAVQALKNPTITAGAPYKPMALANVLPDGAIVKFDGVDIRV